MFRLQHLNGRELDLDNSELVARYEQYKDNFDGTKIQVITAGGVPVGRLRVVRGESIYIGGFQILPEYRGQGIGTSILNDLVAESEQTGLPITLEVFNDNDDAIKLYEKVGFVMTEQNDNQKIMRFELK